MKLLLKTGTVLLWCSNPHNCERTRLYGQVSMCIPQQSKRIGPAHVILTTTKRLTQRTSLVVEPVPGHVRRTGGHFVGHVPGSAPVRRTNFMCIAPVQPTGSFLQRRDRCACPGEDCTPLVVEPVPGHVRCTLPASNIDTVTTCNALSAASLVRAGGLRQCDARGRCH